MQVSGPHIKTRASTESGSRSLLNSRLRLGLLRGRPQWIFLDLAPTRWEARHPLRYIRGVRLWYAIRQSGFTMLGCRRGRYLYELALDLEDRQIPGTFADCGAWNGGSTALMAAGSQGRPAWAFDSFEGLPAPGAVDTDADHSWAGDAVGVEANLRAAMARWAPASALTVVKGWFDETLPRAASEMPDIALLHADGDWYESVFLTLDHLYDRVSVGGVVAVDDYGVWVGAKQATDDFRSRHGITSRLHIRETGVWWIKE